MHASSIEKMSRVAKLLKNIFQTSGKKCRIIDIGGINSYSYKEFFDDVMECEYLTMNVRFSSDAPQLADITVDKAYTWPELQDASYDAVISGQTFEHIEFFWCTLLEMQRILVPGGLLAVTAPSHWQEHRSPYDCYRFYADGFLAMAKFIGMETVYCYAEHEKFTQRRHGDAILVARKPEKSLIEDAKYRTAHKALLELLPSDNIVEVSRGRPVWQSSISAEWQSERHGIVPGNAVSGIFTGNYSFHTSRQRQPWWMVDLTKVYDIVKIKVFNRQIGNCAARAKNMDILTSRDMLVWEEIYSGDMTFGGIFDGAPLECILNDGIEARFVRIQLRDQSILHLDQVQVFARI